jgi:type I restriction enzyme, S subunit
MSEWKTYKLSELVEIKYGKDHKHLADGEIPLYGSGGIMRYVDTPLYEQESILIPRKGTLSNLFYLNIPFWSVDTMFYTKIKEGNNGKYLYYLLKSMDLASMNVGSAVPSLTTEVLNKVEINVPDVATQIEIAQILTSLDDKIELNLQMNQTLEAMAQALFKEWFVNFNFPNFDGELENGLPKGWRMGKFEELMEFTNGYAFKSTDLLDNYEDDCYFVFKMGNIKKGGGLKYDGTKSFYKKENAQNLKKYILKRGDLLMCMTDMKDNVALLGHTALMNEDDKFIVNQRVGLLRPKNDISIDYPYLYILTNFPEFIVELRSRANRGVQVNLSTSEIKNIQVVIPPKNINALFDSTLKPVFNKIFSNIEQIQSLTQTRDTLLPKLMSGKLELV